MGEQRWHIPHVGIVMSLLSQWWLLAGLIGLFAFIKLWPDDETDETDETNEGGSTDESGETGEGGSTDEAVPVGVSSMDAIHVAADHPIEGEHVVPERPAVSVGWSRPHVIVDGDGLAAARWPDVDLETSRQWAVDAADQIAERFGTCVAVLFAPGADGLNNGSHAHVALTIDDATLATVARAFVRRAGFGRVHRAGRHRRVRDRRRGLVERWLGDALLDWLALGESVGRSRARCRA